MFFIFRHLSGIIKCLIVRFVLVIGDAPENLNMMKLINSDQSQYADDSAQGHKLVHNSQWIGWLDQLIVFILVFLWFYTGLDKIVDYSAYWKAMHYQFLPRELLFILVPVLPLAEILTGCMLISPKFKILGLWCSAGLMTVFTIYAGLVYLGYFALRPCACAGLFSKLSWGAHFLINISLMLVALFGLIIYRIRRKEGRHI